MNVAEYQRPFRHWVIDDLIDRVFWAPIVGALPPKRAANWVRYKNDVEKKRTIRDFPYGSTAEAFLMSLHSWTWRAFLERLTGIGNLSPDETSHGGGIHVSDPGGFLGAHIDYALHPAKPHMERRLNLIMFLSDCKGGEFLLYDDEGRNVVSRVKPKEGRLVIWEPTDTAFHGTAKVEGGQRITVAVYYLCPARPSAVRKRALFVPKRG